MDGIYFFGEYERWNLGWSNPNQAGVFVAMLLAWGWGIADFPKIHSHSYRGGWVGAVLVGEAWLWFLLSKTYSRGAFLAAVIGMLVYVGLTRQKAFLPWIIRLLMIVGIVFSTGFFGRISPEFVVQDGSSMNRLTLWKGGLQMMAVSPWQGWGVGRSGEDYMNWFQPLESDPDYAGMVNSYLHVAVERGLPMLGWCLALAVGFLVVCGILVRRQGRAFSLLASAGSCIAVFLVANIFSTLWIFPNLWWLPTIACLLILALMCRSSGWKPLIHGVIGATWTFAIIMLFTVSLQWFGSSFFDTREIRLNKGNIFYGEGGDLEKTVLLLPDSTVLGEKWGKEMRKLATDQSDLSLVVPQNDFYNLGNSSNPRNKVEWIVSFGSRWSEAFAIAEKHPTARLILIHPLGKLHDERPPTGEVLVLTPGLDTMGWGRRWKSSSRANGWKYRQNRGVGQDIRIVWPEVLRGEFLGNSLGELGED